MLLSIIIPVYNAEKFIERCVISIINQAEGLDNIELVIINDGSTDNSLEILKNLQKLYPIIVLFEQENSGVGFTRRSGLEKTQGDYIWFIDADDYIEGSILKKIFKILINDKPETILFGYKLVDLDGNTISETQYKDEVLSRNEIINKSMFNNNVWSKVINRNLIKSNEISFDTSVKTAEDFDFSFRVLYFSEKIVSLKDVSYNYVVNPDSISNIRSTEHLERLANDSAVVANNISVFLNINEPHFKGSKKLFGLWRDNFLYGLLLSVFRFNYDIKFISQLINTLKENNNYPVNISGMKFKKKIFMSFGNHKTLFLIVCKIKRLF